jgi:hypothetical protein
VWVMDVIPGILGPWTSFQGSWALDDPGHDSGFLLGAWLPCGPVSVVWESGSLRLSQLYKQNRQLARPLLVDHISTALGQRCSV